MGPGAQWRILDLPSKAKDSLKTRVKLFLLSNQESRYRYPTKSEINKKSIWAAHPGHESLPWNVVLLEPDPVTNCTVIERDGPWRSRRVTHPMSWPRPGRSSSLPTGTRPET